MPLPTTTIVPDARLGVVSTMLEGTQPELCTIKRRTFTKSASGGDVQTLKIVATDVPFRARAQGKRVIAGQSGDEPKEAARWELSFPKGQDIRAVTDRVYSNLGRVWDVLNASDESYEPESRVLCVEVIV